MHLPRARDRLVHRARHGDGAGRAVGLEHRDGAGAALDLHLRPRIHRLLLEEIDVARNADDAVRIDAAQIGPHHGFGPGRGHGGLDAGGDKNRGGEAGEVGFLQKDVVAHAGRE